MADRIVDLEFLIELARNGEGELLAKAMRGNEAVRTAPLVLEFAAAVFAGEIKLKTRKLKYLTRVERWGRARFIEHQVKMEMRARGVQRDPVLRETLTKELCGLYGSDVSAVADFRKHKTEPLPTAVRAATVAAAKRRKSAQK
jgi:hypothetical protein